MNTPTNATSSQPASNGMSKVTKEDIEKLAELSRLSLTDREAEGYAKDIESILQYVSAINETKGKSGGNYTVNTNILREDKKPHEGGMFTDDIVKAFPREEKGFLKAKKIL